jgi:hypothetical protein
MTFTEKPNEITDIYAKQISKNSGQEESFLPVFLNPDRLSKESLKNMQATESD